MATTGWTNADVPWEQFDPRLVEPHLLALAKTACLVEYNSHDYGRYLREVFAGEDVFCAAATRWAAEEVQHGKALRHWCELADPSFDFTAAFAAFTDRIRLPTGVSRSVRGSRAGEMLARCVVECGTSLYYSSLRDEVREPVLRHICARIAADEFRHYSLFHRWCRHWMQSERLSAGERLRVFLSRMAESEDDELAFAWHATTAAGVPYRRRRALSAYLQTSLAVLKARHVDRSIGMVLRAAGLRPGSLLFSGTNTIVRRVVRWRIARVAARAARAPTAPGSPALARAPRPAPARPTVALPAAPPAAGAVG